MTSSRSCAAHYRRLEPEEALEAQRRGAWIVDTRSPDEQREQGGLVPGAAHYPLSVVLWRLDPAVDSSNEKPGLDRQRDRDLPARLLVDPRRVWLRKIGFEHATDIVGGFEAWAAAGLPVEPIPGGQSGDAREIRPGT